MPEPGTVRGKKSDCLVEILDDKTDVDDVGNTGALGWEGSRYVRRLMKMSMGVPILVFLLAFAAGSVAAAGLLPDLAEGRVAGIALLVVAGLAGMTLALVAVHVYEIVRQLDNASALGLVGSKPDVVANGLMAMLRDAGPILGLAAAVYLLAPGPEEDLPRVESG